MSASRLREAAALLRERAEAATPGPWRVLPVGRRADVRGLPENTSYDHRGDSVATAADSEFGAMSERDADYIATMSPPVALALADWLDEVAHRTEVRPKTWRGMSQALAVADAILGGSHG